MMGRVKKPRTLKQLTSEQAMKVASAFMKTIAPVVAMGFGPYTAGKIMSPRNAAVGYARKHAMIGNHPDVELDYSKVLISCGSLPGLQDVRASLHHESGLLLRYNWTVRDKDRDWPRCHDQVLLLAYCPEDGSGDPACYQLTGARRNAGQDTLKLPEEWTGKAIEAYISVISDDRTQAADSEHVGVSV